MMNIRYFVGLMYVQYTLRIRHIIDSNNGNISTFWDNHSQISGKKFNNEVFWHLKENIR